MSIEDEELWNKIRIHFSNSAPRVPSNKIYAKINIEPDDKSTRKLIKNFKLIVDDDDRCVFKSDYREIAVSGFDITKNKSIAIKIQAIPIDDDWKIIESDSCNFSIMNGAVGYFNLSVKFNWTEDESKANVLVTWTHIGDEIAQKYVVNLDNKEIQYVYPRPRDKVLTYYIHNLKAGGKHTIQVIAKLRNGKETRHRTDKIEFRVPEKKDLQSAEEVLNVQNEPTPTRLSAFKNMDDDEEEKEEEKEEEPPPAYDGFKDRAAELLRRLERQIEDKKLCHQLFTVSSLPRYLSLQTSAETE